MNSRWVIILFLFAVCCKPKTASKNILPVDQMKEVMWDMIQADELASSISAKDSTKNLKEETLKLYSKVYVLHKISVEDFKNSYDYYKKNPTMEKVLIDSLFSYSNKRK